MWSKISNQEKNMISIKVHQSYRTVVGVCDSNLIGKYFEEGKRQLDLRESFYKEKEVDFDEAVKIIQIQITEDATFNIVGSQAIKAAIKAELISEERVDKIDGVPFAMTLK